MKEDVALSLAEEEGETSWNRNTSWSWSWVVLFTLNSMPAWEEVWLYEDVLLLLCGGGLALEPPDRAPVNLANWPAVKTSAFSFGKVKATVLVEDQFDLAGVHPTGLTALAISRSKMPWDSENWEGHSTHSLVPGAPFHIRTQERVSG